jgi:hypothetical protein
MNDKIFFHPCPGWILLISNVRNKIFMVDPSLGSNSYPLVARYVVVHVTRVVTSSFGMLGDIIISEPKAYIAFAWKRVIKQTLGHKVIKYFRVTENLFGHGLFDIIIPHNLLKGVLSELFQLYSLRKKMTVSFFLISKNDQIDFWKC